MSDPHRLSNDPPLLEEEPNRSVSPLIWILLLIALIAFAWYFYNQRTALGPLDAVPPNTDSALVEPDANEQDIKSPASEDTKATPSKSTSPIAKSAVKRRDRDVALVGRPRIDYPRDAFRAGEEGTVMVVAHIDAAGRVSSVRLAQRSGSRVLDRAAMSEIRRWKFKPAMRDGRTIASSVRVPVDYRLSDRQ
ncbi:energy transducer TonB [Luteimonas panaciterrae]|uniref:energy transducer TonB n=1 Tax=Luteimonas panaciterrae TaxID=363885 RepID=UPI001CF97C0A|nr:energy transducer TonB [Luteimonas panaciterrae]